VPDPVHLVGLVDTSVVIDMERIERETLPRQLMVSAITMAELACGPHVTADPAERARRQERLQRAEATFDPLPFDDRVARAYGRIYQAVTAAGGRARGPRTMDLLIATTALAAEVPLLTVNGDDFVGLDDLIRVVRVVPDA
jgi:predicted nucleic acid-binding protein